jgi:peroxiredoxin 2/4
MGRTVRAIRDGFEVTIPFPIVEDPSMAVDRAFGMLDDTAQDSSAVRATYYIDPEGIIRAISWYPMSVGRSVDEMLRLLSALQRTASGDVMTPEGWQPGGDVLHPPTQDSDALAVDAPATWFCQLRPAV